MTRTEDRFTLGLLALASYRLTRALTLDAVADPLRTKVIARYGTRGWGQLVDCPWCAGWWISGVVIVCAVIAGLLPRRLRTLAWWPAVAGLQGLLQSLETKLTESEHD